LIFLASQLKKSYVKLEVLRYDTTDNLQRRAPAFVLFGLALIRRHMHVHGRYAAKVQHLIASDIHIYTNHTALHVCFSHRCAPVKGFDRFVTVYCTAVSIPPIPPTVVADPALIAICPAPIQARNIGNLVPLFFLATFLCDCEDTTLFPLQIENLHRHRSQRHPKSKKCQNVMFVLPSRGTL